MSDVHRFGCDRRIKFSLTVKQRFWKYGIMQMKGTLRDSSEIFEQSLLMAHYFVALVRYIAKLH